MKIRTVAFAAVAVLAVASSFTFAQTVDASIDCGGVFVGGDTVEITGSVSNLTADPIQVALSISLDVPDIGLLPLVNTAIVLGGDATISRTLNLRVPPSAPAGDYTATLTAEAGDDIIMDMCMFTVE